MNHELSIFKFGGASVSDANRIKNVKSIIDSFMPSKMVVVVSAMGKMTNAFENVFQSYVVSDQSLSTQLLAIVEHHQIVCNDLDLDKEWFGDHAHALIAVTEKGIEREGKKDKAFVYDQIVSLGELFSTSIVEKYLSKNGLKSAWLDVRSVLMTDDRYKDAKVDFDRTTKLVKEKIDLLINDYDCIITQGFIGCTKEGFTTTLGREGSDYTAAIFGYSLDAKEISIWKDVPGILTADPRRFENVEKLDRLSYREAIEMTYYGAKVIHPKTIQPIQNKNIKLNVRSFNDVSNAGTVIGSEGLLNYPPIVVVQDDVVLIQIFSMDFAFIAEDHLSLIFSQLNKHRIKMCIMRNSAVSFTICVEDPGEEKLEAFKLALGDNFSFDIIKNLQLLTVRHFQQSVINSLIENKVVMFRETLKNTMQLVVKPSMVLKEKI